MSCGPRGGLETNGGKLRSKGLNALILLQVLAPLSSSPRKAVSSTAKYSAPIRRHAGCSCPTLVSSANEGNS
jgi:hypothetical protein